MSDWPIAESFISQHTTLTRDRHPCTRQDSNPQSQQTSGCRPMPYSAQPLGSAFLAFSRHKIQFGAQFYSTSVRLLKMFVQYHGCLESSAPCFLLGKYLFVNCRGYT